MAKSDERDPKSEIPDGFDALSAARELDESLDAEAAPAASPEEYVNMLESEVEGLGNLLAQKDERLRRAEKRVEEQLEEVEKIKHRLALDAERSAEERVTKVLAEMLAVADDLERAIEAAKAMDHNPEVVRGVELVHKSLLTRFAKLGVEQEPCLGARFDPSRHEAVSMMPTDDPAQDGVIMAVAQEGYRYRGKLLRESRVVVGKLQG